MVDDVKKQKKKQMAKLYGLTESRTMLDELLTQLPYSVDLIGPRWEPPSPK